MSEGSDNPTSSSSPREGHLDSARTRTNHASLNNARSMRTTHGFRHTMRDKLRAVDAPHVIQHAIGGWGKKDHGDNYGLGYKLGKFQPCLSKVVV